MKIIFTFFLFTITPLFAQSDCKDIHINTDNRTGIVKFESPLAFDMQYSKIITKEGDSSILLYLQMVVSYTNTNEKGCILYLSDSSKLEFPEQQVTITSMPLFRYKYSTVLTLSPANVTKLLQVSIVDFKLHIHNSTVRPVLTKKKNAKQLSDYLRCILKGVKN